MVHYEGGVTHLFAEATPRAEDGGEPSSAAWRQRDAEQWSNAEVRSFLKAILPGHACAGTSFAYMNGKVLSTLSKDDLRQGMRGDEEAVNVIWAELQRQREARRDLAEVEAKGAQPFLLYVRTPRDILVELEVVPSETVAEVKARVAETEGTPVDMQRLTRNGIPMLDGKMLASYGVTHGTTLLLVPRLSVGGSGRAPPPAARSPAGGHSGMPKPRVPIVCTDIARPFPMCLEFPGVAEYQSFMLSVQREGCRRSTSAVQSANEAAPFLEILATSSMHKPVQTRIVFDSVAEMLRIDTLGDILMENTRYKVMLHLRVEQKFASLVTGMLS